MKKSTSFLLTVFSVTVFLMLQISGIVFAKSIMLGDSVEVTAKVVGIDYADRSVDLLGPEGNVVSVEVGDAAHNFDKVKIGDNLKVKYYESVAMYLGLSGKAPAVTADVITARSKKGDMPAGMIVEWADVSAKVMAVDKKSRILTLELPDKRTKKTKVDESVKAFDKVKVGDMIHVRYTEAIAITVETP